MYRENGDDTIRRGDFPNVADQVLEYNMRLIPFVHQLKVMQMLLLQLVQQHGLKDSAIVSAAIPPDPEFDDDTLRVKVDEAGRVVPLWDDLHESLSELLIDMMISRNMATHLAPPAPQMTVKNSMSATSAADESHVSSAMPGELFTSPPSRGSYNSGSDALASPAAIFKELRVADGITRLQLHSVPPNFDSEFHRNDTDEYAGGLPARLPPRPGGGRRQSLAARLSIPSGLQIVPPATPLIRRNSVGSLPAVTPSSLSLDIRGKQFAHDV